MLPTTHPSIHSPIHPLIHPVFTCSPVSRSQSVGWSWGRCVGRTQVLWWPSDSSGEVGTPAGSRGWWCSRHRWHLNSHRMAQALDGEREREREQNHYHCLTQNSGECRIQFIFSAATQSAIPVGLVYVEGGPRKCSTIRSELYVAKGPPALYHLV